MRWIQDKSILANTLITLTQWWLRFRAMLLLQQDFIVTALDRIRDCRWIRDFDTWLGKYQEGK